MLGRTVGNYKISAVVAEGGMGTVFVAEHPGLARKAAIKVLRPELASDPEAVSRFFNEAKVSNVVRHTGIVDIYDYGNLPDGTPYIAMELLEGETLARRVARGGVTLAEAMDFGVQLASALAAAHSAGVIHRDLKPENIYLTHSPQGDSSRVVKILDFGIAKLEKNWLRVGHHTRTGALMGTPKYMSPEQCQGLREVDFRTDIYSLGVILYELFTGRAPFLSPGVGELINLQINAQPRPPQELNPNLSDELQAIVLRALAKVPEDRFASMTSFQDALIAESVRLNLWPDRGRTIIGHVFVAPPAPYARRPAHSTTLSVAADARGATSPLQGAEGPKKRWGLAFVAVLLCGLAAGTVFVLWPALRGQKENEQAVITREAGRLDIRFESSPPGAAVYQGDVLVVRTPGSASLRRSEEPSEFHFVLPGHRRETVRALLNVGLTLSAELTPVAPAAPATPPAAAAAPPPKPLAPFPLTARPSYRSKPRPQLPSQPAPPPRYDDIRSER